MSIRSVANVFFLILVSARFAVAAERVKESDQSFTVIQAERELKSSVNHFNEDLKEDWKNYLKENGLDEELEAATTERLKDAYFAGIEAWGAAAETCEPAQANRRWLARLLKHLGLDETKERHQEIEHVLAGLAAERLSECAEPAAQAALKAERELHAFVSERLRIMIDFLSSLPAGSVRISVRGRLMRLQKKVMVEHPLADRSVSVNALRLKTLASQADPEIVERLEKDPGLQRPFDLPQALGDLGKVIHKKAPLRNKLAQEIKRDKEEEHKRDRYLSLRTDVSQTENQQTESHSTVAPATPVTPDKDPYPLQMPWLLK